VFNNPISGIILAGVLGEVVTKITLLSILAIIFYSANYFSNSNYGKCFLATLP
jgi:hypothetical protein